MDKNEPKWEPQYGNWTEDRIMMSDTYVLTNSSSRGEYGVMLQQPTCPYKGNGAIFWIDPHHIYCRYDWGLWFPVADNDPKNCAAICKRRTGILYLCSQTSILHIPVKIYHIDRLPRELFGDPGEGEPSQPHDARSLSDKTQAEAGEGPVKGADAAGFVTDAVRRFGGSLLAKADGKQYPCAFYELNGHLLFFSFFNHVGDWLADEELIGDAQWTTWFSESSMAISPLAAAVSLRERLVPLIPQEIPVRAIVVLASDCLVINESEFIPLWDSQHVSFVREKALAESEMPSIDQLLEGIKYNGNSRKALEKCAPAIYAVLENLRPANA